MTHLLRYILLIVYANIIEHKRKKNQYSLQNKMLIKLVYIASIVRKTQTLHSLRVIATTGVIACRLHGCHFKWNLITSCFLSENFVSSTIFCF